jgi:hypothetical protein
MTARSNTLRSVVLLFWILLPHFAFGSAIAADAGEAGKIGSGNPGLKAVSKNPAGIAIYQDEPETVGNGLMGGFRTRHIRVIVDQGYGFNQENMDVNGLKQLYPFDPDSAFSCSGGQWGSPSNWQYEPRTSTLYRTNENKVEVTQDVQEMARAKYNLTPNEVFLGYIDGKVFYWRSFDPSRVFWKEHGSHIELSVPMPAGIIDIYGATRGIRKDIGFVVFRKSQGLIQYSPYTSDFVEISLSK